MSPSFYDAFRISFYLCKGTFGSLQLVQCSLVPYGKFLVVSKDAPGLFSELFFCWASIRWEGEMFHDLSEVNLGFGHFRREYLEVFQGDTAGYWVIISGFHDLVVGNAMWYVVRGLRGIHVWWDVSYGIHCRNWVVIFLVRMSRVGGAFLCGACSCGDQIYSHFRVWGGAGSFAFEEEASSSWGF